jgi:hypothetical protein
MKRRYLMLAPQQTLDTSIDRVEDALDALDERHALLLTYQGVDTPARRLEIHVWKEVGGAVLLRLVADGELGACYLEVAAPHDAAADEVVAVLRGGGLAVIEPRALVADAEEIFDADPGALERAAIANQGRDEALLRLLRRALAHPDESVRVAAASAAAYVQSPELEPDLRARMAAESSDTVRAVLRHAIADITGRSPTEDESA